MGAPQPPAAECKTLWIGDVQPNWDEGYVGTIFTNAGLETDDVVEVKLIRDKHTGFPAGYGFVEFQNREVAEKVLENCNGNPIPGTSFRFRLNWGAGGKRLETAPEFSIFVGDLAPEVTDAMLQDAFTEKFPSTLGAKVVMDPVSGMSKGFGFVRFSIEEEKDDALSTMTGVACGSRPIRVAPATAKKATALSSSTFEPGSSVTSGLEGEDPSNTTVFVGGIDSSVTEEVLREHFTQFGEIVYVKIPPGRGCGFVQYVQRQAAETAISRMQGGDVKGCKVRLSWGRSSPARARDPMTGAPGVYPGGPNYGPGPSSGYPPQYQQQYYTPQVAYAAPPHGGNYAAPPYQYQAGPYTHMTYAPTYGPGPGYQPAGPAYVQPYSPTVDMGPMGGMGGDRSPSGGSSLASYGNVSYFDRSAPDPNHRHGGRHIHKAGGGGGGSMKGLSSRLEGLDMSGEGPAYGGPKVMGGRGGPRKPGGYRMQGGGGGGGYGPPSYPPSGHDPHYPPPSGAPMGYAPR